MLGSWVRAPSGSQGKEALRPLFLLLEVLTQGFFDLKVKASKLDYEPQADHKEKRLSGLFSLLLGGSLFYCSLQHFTERRMDMHHVTELVGSGVATHQDTNLLNDIGSMSTIGMTAQNTMLIR